MDTPEKHDGPNGRQPNGRFSKGNSISPGRRPAHKDLAYLRRFRSEVDLEKFGAMVGQLFEIAMDPSVRPQDRIRAMELICRFCLPEPVSRVSFERGLFDPDAEDTEFRIAGSSGSEVDERMFALVERLYRQQVQYERDIEQRYGAQEPNRN